MSVHMITDLISHSDTVISDFQTTQHNILYTMHTQFLYMDYKGQH